MEMPAPDVHYRNLLSQLKPPAIVRKDDRGVFDSLMPGLVDRRDEVIQASLNGLSAAEIRASKTRCYKPAREPICFKFIVGQNGSLNAAIAYDSDGRPLMLNYAVLLRGNRPAIIIYYQSSGSQPGTEEEWLLAKNVAYVTADDNTLLTKIKGGFERYKGQK